MRAVAVTSPGGPENLRLTEVPKPVPGRGEVLVDVVAAGVNRADLLQRQGHYPPPVGVTDILGLEVSGRVAELGDEVEGWAIGQPCVVLLAGGGYAEQVVAPFGQLAPIPAGIDLVSAAGLIEVAATVVSNLAVARLSEHESFLVHGGAGGVGSFAIQYARGLGAHVLATAGSDSKLAYCRDLGAEVAIDYHDDWPAKVANATHGNGVDVILDNMGAKYLADNIAALGRNGRLVIIGLQGGRKATLDLNDLLPHSKSVTATTLRLRPAPDKAAIVADTVAAAWPMIEDGRIRVGAPKAFPLDEVAQAHRWLETGEHTGKVVLVVGG